MKQSGLARFSGAARLLQQLGDETGPASLVLGAEPGAGIAVEVLMKQDEIAKVGGVLELVRVSVDRSSAAGVALEDARQTSRLVEALQRLDEEVVGGESDGPAPAGVTPEQPAS